MSTHSLALISAVTSVCTLLSLGLFARMFSAWLAAIERRLSARKDD